MAKSKNVYQLPVPWEAVTFQTSDSPGHPPPYDRAIDFAVPLGTVVLAPADGEVITVVDQFDRYGPTVDFADSLNYVQILHANNEVSDLGHLARDSVVVKVGDTVRTKDIIAKTGLSGFMTAPHLHWMVYRRTNSGAGFQSLQPLMNARLD